MQNIKKIGLRNDSHAIGCQFDRDLTGKVFSQLENSGFKWIKMGHGSRLETSKPLEKPDTLKDEKYIDLTKNCFNCNNFVKKYLNLVNEQKIMK